LAQDVAILDFGSGKVSVIIGQRGVNNTICISGTGECDYDGFTDGAFLDPENLPYVVGRALTSAQANSGTQIRHLFIGVPGDFTSCVCHDVSFNLGRKRTVTEEDVETLHKQGNKYEHHPQYTLVNIQPIYYTLDDERRLVQPVGLKSGKIGGLISYVLAENDFLSLINKIMSTLNIEYYDYVSSLLAEVLFLFDDVKRDQYVVLIDCGYITTNVALARGDGLLQQFNIPLGGGHITADLATYLNISFTQAEALKRKVVLSLDAGPDDLYEVNNGRDDAVSFHADAVNEIVMNQINIIAATVAKSLASCKYEFPDYIPYHLTGGGLSYIKGARDYLSRVIEKPVEIVAPSLPQFNRPHLSSSLGLLDMILDNSPEANKKSFFARLFGK
jgi:cell division protein FtsA